MSKQNQDILEFAPFRLDPGESLLTSGGTAIPLPPKVFDLLVYLAGNAGRLSEKEELLRALWPDSFVEEANLTVNVAALRRSLGTQAGGQPWIETVPKRGYRFIGKVTRHPREVRLSAPEPALSSPPMTVGLDWRPLLAAAAVLGVLAAGFFYLRGPSGSRAVGNGRQVLAVLPFQDLSAVGAEMHAGLGMTDALIARLGAAQTLIVRPLITVRKYDGSGEDPLEQGKALGADTVLTGSVQRIENRIRVMVQLFRVQDGQSLWTEKFDEFFTNLFAVQDTISEKLAHVLELRLTSEEQERMLRRYTENTEAFRLYELGRYERFRTASKAVDYLKQSIQEDSRYVLPYVELADMYVAYAGNGLGNFERYEPLARSAVESALRFGPDLADAHVASANFKRFIERDFTGASREIEAALKLNPQSARVHSFRGILLAVQGDLPGAVAEGQKAMRMDPFNVEIEGDFAWELYLSRRYEESLAVIEEFEQRAPQRKDLWNRFYCQVKLARFDGAIQMMEKAMEQAADRKAGLVLIAQAHAAAGRPEKAREALKKVPEAYGHYQRAVVDAICGDRDDAIRQLNQAAEEHSVWIEWLKVDPSLDALRSDPRFGDVIRRVGLTP